MAMTEMLPLTEPSEKTALKIYYDNDFTITRGSAQTVTITDLTQIATVILLYRTTNSIHTFCTYLDEDDIKTRPTFTYAYEYSANDKITGISGNTFTYQWNGSGTLSDFYLIAIGY